MAFLQFMIVTIVVAAAFGYAAWALAPATLRRRLAHSIARTLGGSETGGFRGSIARRFEGIAGKTAGGCSDCSANILTPAERKSQRN